MMNDYNSLGNSNENNNREEYGKKSLIPYLRGYTWLQIRRGDVPQKSINVVKQIYRNTTSKIKVGKLLSENSNL